MSCSTERLVVPLVGDDGDLDDSCVSFVYALDVYTQPAEPRTNDYPGCDESHEIGTVRKVWIEFPVPRGQGMSGTHHYRQQRLDGETFRWAVDYLATRRAEMADDDKFLEEYAT